MSDTPADERRHFTRISMDSRLLLHCDGRQWESRLLDLSLKGALFQRPEGFEGDAGAQCSIEMLLEPHDIVIAMEGRIAHSEGGHIGFHCDYIDLDSISHLKRLIELNLGNDALLERELAELVAGE
jgi:hypothetical protein